MTQLEIFYRLVMICDLFLLIFRFVVYGLVEKDSQHSFLFLLNENLISVPARAPVAPQTRLKLFVFDLTI